MLPLLLALACATPAPSEPDPPPVAPPPAEPPPPPGPVEVGRARIAAVGDVLVHRRVKAAAKARDERDAAGLSTNNGGFDWVWAAVAPQIRAADLAFANLEGPVAPDADRGVRGEVFNSPAEVLPSLADAGFDVLSFANNHTFDQGAAGILETLRRARAEGLAILGSGETCAAAHAPTITSAGGIRIAWLAMTDLMNLNENAGEDAPCTFNTGPVCRADCGPYRDAIHYSIDETRVLGAVRAARAAADALVVSFHWGDEYRTEPLPLYREWGPKLIEAGADVVLGHHPHVLQPIARHVAADGRQGLIAYSLGNFVSDMESSYQLGRSGGRGGRTRDGLLLSFTLVRTRHPDGRTLTALEDVSVAPLWTENATIRGVPHVRVVPHDDALAASRRAIVAGIVGQEWLP